MKESNNVRNTQIIKTMVVVSGIILILAGIIMILMDIKSEGSISIKTPFIEGSINATYVGLLVIFLGVVLELGAILKSYQFSKRNRIIESPDFKVKDQEETGMYYPLNDEDNTD